MDTLGRRLFLLASASLVATRARAGEAAMPAIPLFVRAALDPFPTAVVDDQLARAAELFAPHSFSFVEASARGAVPLDHADVETREHRDAFAKHVVAGVVNVFFVRSLRDVDEPDRMRKGVTWRCLKDLEKKYVLVVAGSPPHVLAHELGHFFGCAHSRVTNNLMSYEREEGKPVFLDSQQGALVRKTARDLFAKGALAARGRQWKKSE